MNTADHSPQSPQSPWKIDEKNFPAEGSLPEQIRFLLGYAILAPSSHNAQPWCFEIGEDGRLRIYADYDGWLRVADADQRELHLSIGCAIENLVIAARRFGMAARIEYLPDPQNKALIADISFDKAGARELGGLTVLFDALPIRQTNHKTFDHRPIEQAVLQIFQQCCEEPGIDLFLTSEEEIRQRFGELIVGSDAATFANADYREELAYWIGKGVFGTSWLMSQIGRMAMANLNFGKMTARSDESVLMSAPVMGVISSYANDRVSQVRGGQVFERIYLTGARLGIGIRPMSQICQVPWQKKALAELIPPGGLTPLQPFLLGYVAISQEHTPRKSVAEVLR
ncbi:MAG: Acg family FMN-binding oxidoreductase [Blastocatellia bacterium]